MDSCSAETHGSICNILNMKRGLLNLTDWAMCLCHIQFIVPLQFYDTNTLNEILVGTFVSHLRSL